MLVRLLPAVLGFAANVGLLLDGLCVSGARRNPPNRRLHPACLGCAGFASVWLPDGIFNFANFPSLSVPVSAACPSVRVPAALRVPAA